ncbi:MAG: ATP-binding protein [Anaerolineales bacterium]|nr:ATP-binding protein [Anaerolineales bacterium]
MSIRFKVILPYLLLTLIVAVTGVYVVTSLVSDSLQERLTNQLLEAGRVVSDDFARQEMSHIETARVVAYTVGLAEALDAGDRAALSDLARPLTAGLGIESLSLIDRQGIERFYRVRLADGNLVDPPVGSGLEALSIVQSFLRAEDAQAAPRRALAYSTVVSQYYYYSALPIELNKRLVGVVLIGSSLDTLLPYLKSTSLADIILYDDLGRAIATTLAGQNANQTFFEKFSISEAAYRQVVTSKNNVAGENFELENRWYSLARSSLRVGGDQLGAFAVILPLDFVLQPGAVSRNNYILLFTGAMLGVIAIGYGISRLLINPIYALVRASQAITAGDLTRRTGVSSSDEIGVLANTFDEMTANLQERTIELERANQTLAQLDQTKSSFIQVAAHELRTPLTLLSGYAQILDVQAKRNPELENISKGLLEGSARMQEVVNSMLDISRIDSKMLKALPDKASLASILQRVEKTFRAAWSERKLIFVTDGVAGLPLVYADPDLLYKLFYHLVMNAIKYTPDGGTISVHGQVVESDGEVELAVKDSGVGIDPRHQQLIFEKFYQTGEVTLHSSGRTKFKGGGPGLGLAIARGIVEAHGGRIWVESPGCDEETNPGSCFYVRLPLKAELAE